jgi:hypothetical protein
MVMCFGRVVGVSRHSVLEMICFVMRCKDLYWVGLCRKSKLNIWTQKWLFLYAVNMKSHQQKEEQKCYQWKLHILHKKWNSCLVCEVPIVSKIFIIATGVYKLCSCVLSKQILLAVCFCC